jgi:hypothetical protein
MKFFATISLFLSALAFAREIPDPPVQDIYASGEVHMTIMSNKYASFDKHRASGAYNSTQYQKITQYTPCQNGKAGEFRCKNIDLSYFVSHAELGSTTGEGSSTWGWTSPDGREIIIIAQVSSHKFYIAMNKLC